MNDVVWSKSGDSAGMGQGGGVGAESFDWSQPARTFQEEKLELDFGDDDNDNEEDGDKEPGDVTVNNGGDEAVITSDKNSSSQLHGDGIGDIMAHQLKFIACIKIMVDELSTLATGFEVDGGQLRYQLYVWLEKEVEVLRHVCNYGLLESTATSVGRSRPSTAFGHGQCFSVLLLRFS